MEADECWITFYLSHLIIVLYLVVLFRWLREVRIHDIPSLIMEILTNFLLPIYEGPHGNFLVCKSTFRSRRKPPGTAFEFRNILFL